MNRSHVTSLISFWTVVVDWQLAGKDVVVDTSLVLFVVFSVSGLVSSLMCIDSMLSVFFLRFFDDNKLCELFPLPGITIGIKLNYWCL